MNEIELSTETMQRLGRIAKAYRKSPSFMAERFIRAFFESEEEYLVEDSEGHVESFFEGYYFSEK